MLRGMHLWAVILISTAQVSGGDAVSEATPAEQLTDLLNDAWEFRLREDPLFATQCGDARYNDRLPQVSLDDQQRRDLVKRGFRDRLASIDRSELSPADRINYDIFTRLVEDELAEYRYQTHLAPISGRSGFHIEFPESRRNVPLVTTQDFENYIARLRGFGDYVDGHIELMRAGVRAGVTQPAVIFEHYRQPLEAHIVVDPEESLLFEPFQELPSTVPASQHPRLKTAVREAIAGSVVPGYQRFLEFMESEYVPNCRTSVGAASLPEGREFYRYRTRRFTTLKVTPEEVHARGLKEVARIRGEMEAIIQQIGFAGDFAGFVQHLRTEPRFYAQSADELMMHVSYALKRMDGQLPALFGRLPRMPYGVRQVPDYIAPQTTSAYYQPPSGDRTKAGFYYVNTYNLPNRPLYTVEALSLHEAVPGHHLQIALQQEMEDQHEFRKYTGFTVFVEGWALYAERLGLEVGFYQDPYSDFGRLTMEMWRACRLVVDTGVHYFGWTRQQTIDYFVENSALSLHNIRAEVDRYIGWPGQAMAYKTGELKIRELREMAEKQLGERFDVRGFHDVVLGSGAVPLDVLEENVSAWVAVE